MNNDTIAAIATAPGRGSVGIVRLSGPSAFSIAEKISKITSPTARHAYFTQFFDTQNKTLDEGLILHFFAPHSFTGEDVVEFQCHGGPVVLDLLLKTVLSFGARQALPGEFSERAFLNDKIDLTQAEAIADLIDASSERAAKQAIASLQGEFSKHINSLVKQVINLRLFVEAAIDFPEEEIDFLSDPKIFNALNEITASLNKILHSAQQGCLLREGLKVVIAGRPNAGKSSLLNALADNEIAIVTDIKGTTRDTLKETIHLDGLPIQLVDTAGLHNTDDQIEQIGIERAWSEINQADMILLICDSTDAQQINPKHAWPEFLQCDKSKNKTLVVFNKCDLSGWIKPPGSSDTETAVCVSAKTKAGLDQLKLTIFNRFGLEHNTEGIISAKRRHLDALNRTKEALDRGSALINDHMSAGELLAEELKLAQNYLGEITGRVTPDELLGKIFSSFCIGK